MTSVTATARSLLCAAALLLSMAALSDGTTKDQYCSLCSSNTMCLYSGVSDKCYQGRWDHGVPADQQAVIVDVHNRLRNKVALGQETSGAPGPQSAASNMQRMAWDDELAQVAQRWADQCNYQHDACRNVPRFYVGQNLYLTLQWPCSSVDNNQHWDDAINGWYNEVAQFNKDAVGSLQGVNGVGHYTQVVWADSNLVGCGYSLFQDGDQCEKYYVCNYGPGGNWLGEPLYKTGAARSACPKNNTPDSRYPGLC